MKLPTRPVLLRLFWIGLAAGLLWLTLRAVSFADVWEQLSQLRARQVILLAAVNAFVLFTFSARWWLLLYAQGYAIPYIKLVGYRLAAFAVSYFTPGPHFGGEPLQVYLVTTRHQVPVAASVTAVALDKILEMLVNFTFLMGGVLIVSQTQNLPSMVEQRLLLSGLALLLVPAGALALLWADRRPASSLLVVLAGLWRRLRGDMAVTAVQRGVLYTTLRQSEDQTAALCRQHPLILLLALGVSALSWVGIIGEFWLMTSVLGLGLTLPQALTALLAARIAILLPLPAALGALEASQIIAMRNVGLTAASGVSLSVLIRTRDVVMGLIGVGLLWLLLWRRKENVEDAVAVTTAQPANLSISHADQRIGD